MRAFEAKTFIEPANIWRILLNPAFGDISQYCLDNNAAAVGWSFSDLSDDSDLALSVKKIQTWEDYKACSESYYGNVDSSVKNLHDNVITGDVILMRSHDKRYYFAVVSTQSKWQFNHEARSIDAANQLTNIKWHEIKNVSSISDSLERLFGYLGPTFRRVNRVNKPEIWEFILKTLRDD